MKKTWPVIWLSAGLFPTWVQADVQLYGKINLAFETIAAKGAKDGRDIESMQRVTSNLSYMGFRGSEDLGNGLSAIWQVEQDINPDECRQCGFANRNSYVGLKGQWGRLLAGRHDIYWTSHIPGMDRRIISTGIAGSILSLFGTFGGYAPRADRPTAPLTGGRAPNVLRYETPSWYGVSSTLSFSTAEKQGVSQSDPWAIQGELDYKDAKLAANVVWLESRDSNGFLGSGYTHYPPSMTVEGTRSRAVKAVAMYHFGSGTVLGVGFERLETRFPEGKVSRNAYGVHLGQTLSPAAYMGVHLGQADDVESHVSGGATTQDTGARFISLIGSYSLSKRTLLFAEYARILNDSNAAYTFVSTANLNDSTVGRVAGKGADPRTLMVGINHTF